MLAILIAMVFGGVSTKMIDYQTSYCECYRAKFEGKTCEEFKAHAFKYSTPANTQGSCHE